MRQIVWCRDESVALGRHRDFPRVQAIGNLAASPAAVVKPKGVALRFAHHDAAGAAIAQRIEQDAELQSR